MPDKESGKYSRALSLQGRASLNWSSVGRGRPWETSIEIMLIVGKRLQRASTRRQTDVPGS
jgi:hypothetical protein